MDKIDEIERCSPPKGALCVIDVMSTSSHPGLRLRSAPEGHSLIVCHSAVCARMRRLTDARCGASLCCCRRSAATGRVFVHARIRTRCVSLAVSIFRGNWIHLKCRRGGRIDRSARARPRVNETLKQERGKLRDTERGYLHVFMQIYTWRDEMSYLWDGKSHTYSFHIESHIYEIESQEEVEAMS